jgi:glycosyltransferase involved in cell wall biosynthesis
MRQGGRQAAGMQLLREDGQKEVMLQTVVVPAARKKVQQSGCTKMGPTTLHARGRMPHVTYIVTDPLTVKIYLKPQLEAFLRRDWQVSVICGGDKASLPGIEELEGVNLYHVPMVREIAPVRDGLALVRLILLLVRLRPTIVNAGTPKAGLLGMIASRLALVPMRVYQLHGLRLETATGWRRLVFLMTERTACWCSQRVLCVSKTLKDKVIELGICKSQKLVVLGSGSCVGIHLADYAPGPEQLAVAAAVKSKLEIPEKAPVVGFIGRLTRDKGIIDLLEAFAAVRRKHSSAYLLLIGPFEEGDPLPENVRLEITQNAFIRHVAWTDDPRPYLHLMNVFVLPTYREGLPGVLLEAAAAETPIVATRATGVTDVVVDGETGLISSIGDVDSMADNIGKLLTNAGLARRLSQMALSKVQSEFTRERVLHLLETFYRESLNEYRLAA